MNANVFIVVNKMITEYRVQITEYGEGFSFYLYLYLNGDDDFGPQFLGPQNSHLPSTILVHTGDIRLGYSAKVGTAFRFEITDEIQFHVDLESIVIESDHGVMGSSGNVGPEIINRVLKVDEIFGILGKFVSENAESGFGTTLEFGTFGEGIHDDFLVFKECERSIAWSRSSTVDGSRGFKVSILATIDSVIISRLIIFCTPVFSVACTEC